MPLSSTCLQHTRWKNTSTRQPRGKTSACKTKRFTRKMSCKHGQTTNRSQSSLHCPDKLPPFRLSNVLKRLKTQTVKPTNALVSPGRKKTRLCLFVCFYLRFDRANFRRSHRAPSREESLHGRRSSVPTARTHRPLKPRCCKSVREGGGDPAEPSRAVPSRPPSGDLSGSDRPPPVTSPPLLTC